MLVAPRTAREWCTFGDASIGLTAGSGRDGAGDTDRRDELNDDRRLGVSAGGFIGIGSDTGVPGADGVGEPTASDDASAMCAVRGPKSGGAGLLDDMRRDGSSIFENLPCCAVTGCPSFVRRV